ncbi:MAG: cytochrome B6, partial [Tannerella sp.]|nr:cytochrome B6 [Tannerella sp.]
IGGLFWDGRANSLEEQAKLPFTNPLEMGNTDDKMVVDKVKKATYYPAFKKIYGDLEDTEAIFNAIADAIDAYERSVEVNPFSSKYDAFLESKYQFTEDEACGMELFINKGLCANCHVTTPDPYAKRVLFTDHTYDNLGIPANPGNPFYTIPQIHNPNGCDAIDLGLGAIVKSDKENGKFRVPTLRNIELTAPYGHNGFFKSLEDIVHFYNVRDVGSEYPKAEYAETVNTEELGDLKLTPEEESYIVIFLKTLSDGYNPAK